MSGDRPYGSSAMNIDGLKPQGRVSKVVSNTREQAAKYDQLTSAQSGIDISVEALQTASLINSSFDDTALETLTKESTDPRSDFVLSQIARDMRHFCGLLSFHTLFPVMRGAAFCVGDAADVAVFMDAEKGKFFEDTAKALPTPLLKKWRVEWGDGWSGCMVAAKDIQDQLNSNAYESVLSAFGSAEKNPIATKYA